MSGSINCVDEDFIEKCIRISRVKRDVWNAFIQENGEAASKTLEAIREHRDTLRGGINIREMVAKWKKDMDSADQKDGFVIVAKREGTAVITTQNDAKSVNGPIAMLPVCKGSVYSILYKSMTEGTLYAKRLRISRYALKKECRIIPEGCVLVKVLPGGDNVVQIGINSKTRRSRLPITIRFDDLTRTDTFIARSTCRKGYKVTSYPVAWISLIRGTADNQCNDPETLADGAAKEIAQASGEVANEPKGNGEVTGAPGSQVLEDDEREFARCLNVFEKHSNNWLELAQAYERLSKLPADLWQRNGSPRSLTRFLTGRFDITEGRLSQINGAYKAWKELGDKANGLACSALYEIYRFKNSRHNDGKMDAEQILEAIRQAAGSVTKYSAREWADKRRPGRSGTKAKVTTGNPFERICLDLDVMIASLCSAAENPTMAQRGALLEKCRTLLRVIHNLD